MSSFWPHHQDVHDTDAQHPKALECCRQRQMPNEQKVDYETIPGAVTPFQQLLRFVLPSWLFQTGK